MYYKAQNAMCFCFCSDPPDTCLRGDGTYYCANTKGDDHVNCGGCATQCGAATVWYVMFTITEYLLNS